MKKITTLLLLLALLVPSLIACSSEDSGNSGNNTTIQAGNDTTAVSETTDPNSVFEIPDGANYDGYEFVIFVYDIGAESVENGYNMAINYSPILADEETGEPINDAVYQRNRTVEDVLNIKITPQISPKNEMTSIITREVQAGDTSFDTAMQMIRAAQNMGMEGYHMRLDEIETLNLEKNWWAQAIQTQAAINNAIYVITGDATIEDKESLATMFYNEKIAEDFNLGNIYDIVNNGKWTVDTMMEQFKTVSADLNGDGVINHMDRAGTGTNYTSLCSFLNAFGTGYAHLENGVPVSDLDNEFTVNAVSKVAEIMNDATCVLISAKTEGSWGAFTNMFKDDRLLIRSGCYYNTPGFRDMDSEFSIIPFPKYNEIQEDYCVPAGPHASCGFVIPVTCSDPEMVGVILETLSYNSTNTVLDAYVNITLEGKIARNEESIAMMHKMIAGTYYDIGYVYDWAGINKVAYQSIQNGDSQFASAYAAVRDQYLAAMEDTYNMYK